MLTYLARRLVLAAIIGNVALRRACLPIYFLLDTLTYLLRGGRIGRAQAFVGGVLKVKPVLALRDGEVHPQSRVRSQTQGIAALVELVRATPDLTDLRIVHADAPDLAARLRDALHPMVPNIRPEIVALGPVVGTYSGPNAAFCTTGTAQVGNRYSNSVPPLFQTNS